MAHTLEELVPAALGPWVIGSVFASLGRAIQQLYRLLSPPPRATTESAPRGWSTKQRIITFLSSTIIVRLPACTRYMARLAARGRAPATLPRSTTHPQPHFQPRTALHCTCISHSCSSLLPASRPAELPVCCAHLASARSITDLLPCLAFCSIVTPSAIFVGLAVSPLPSGRSSAPL